MPKQYPRISIVTPCYNQRDYIEECIVSVLGQQYPNLEYIVIDGGSTDGTVDMIKKYEGRITYWVSEKDHGIYDALNKGFQKSTGEIMGWLNSDDILHRRCLFALGEIFSTYSEVEWIQGYPTVIDQGGRIVSHRPHRYAASDFYLKAYRNDDIFIQQESTYWRRSLWEKAGSTLSTKYKYAGDFELWMRFFSHASCYITDLLIGGFRVRGKGQLSSDNYSTYLQECDLVIDAAIQKMPPAEQAALQQLQRQQHIKRKFPVFSKLPGVKKLIDKKQGAGKKIYYDFNTSSFRIR